MARHHGIQFVRQWRVWVILLLLGTAGCGGKGTVSGKVKFKGNPLPSGSVVFFDEKDRQVASASISSDGSYSATVPTGTLKIAITTPSSSLKAMPTAKSKVVSEAIQKMKKGAFNPLESENKDLIPEKTIQIPAKYGSPSDSGLTLTVIGGPQSFDIDLQ
jgi:hypothetical protein